MTLIIINDTVTKNLQLRNAFNLNMDEIEDRLQSVEVISYLRDGNGAPTATMHNDGDFYLDKNDWKLYQKVNGAWQFRTTWTGQVGPKGDRGDPGVGLNSRGVWSNTTAYNLNDAVSYRSSFWRSVRSHTGVEPTTQNTADWERIVAGLHNVGVWAASTAYRVDDYVSYNGSRYRVLTNHTSPATGGLPDATPANYQLIINKGDQGIQGNQGNQGIQGPKGDPGVGLTMRGAWASATAYATSDAVTHRGQMWRALRANTGVEPTTAVTADWERSTHGVFSLGIWAQSTAYRVDDVVTYNGSRYRVLTNHTSPASGGLPDATPANYQLIVERGSQGIQGQQGIQGNQGLQGVKGDKGDQGIQGIRGLTPRGDYNPTTAYVPDDAVTFRGSAWRAVANVTNIEPTTDTVSSWQRMVGGTFYAGEWTTAIKYYVNDLIMYQGRMYMVLTNHTSNAAPAPDNSNTAYRLAAQKGDTGSQGPAGAIAMPFKWYVSGTPTMPRTGEGWEAVIRPCTLDLLVARVGVAPTADLVINLMRSVNGAAATQIASITIPTGQIRTTASPSIALNLGDDLRVDLASGAGFSNLTVVGRGT